MSHSALSVSTPTHPSLAAPSMSARSSGRFSEAVSPNRRGLVEVTASLAGAAGPVGGAIAAGLSAVSGGGGSASDEMSGLWEMQRENQAFNLEYLALQESIQAENRHFTTLSNLAKAQHDTAKAAINNIHV